MTDSSAAEILSQSRYGRRRRRRGAPPTPEGEIKQQILDGLAMLRIPAYRCGVGVFRVKHAGGERVVPIGTPGLPDLVALVPDVGTVWIEVKTKRGRMSPEQQAFRDDCRRAGAIHVVATSWDDVRPFLGARGA